MTATHSNNPRGPRNSAAATPPYTRGPGITSSMEDLLLFIVTFYGLDGSVMTVHGSYFLFLGEASECPGEYWSIDE